MNTIKNEKNDIIIPEAESYRKIAANVEVANIDNNIKTIMVTSTSPGEGKTTTAANIAMVMTEKEKKILLLDFDFHKPSIHKCFNVSNKKGITELLLKKDDYKKYLINVYPKLDLITTGYITSTPSKIINSSAIKDLMKNLSLCYDYIFIDTPPVMAVSDPLTISTYTDAVIFVAAYNDTNKDFARKAVEALKGVNANFIGVVVNKTPQLKSHKYYYNY